MTDQPGGLVERLSQFAQALSEGPQKGMFRCKDMISAAAAFVGECSLRKSAVFDFENHNLKPGSGVFSDRINKVLSGDLTNWPDIPAASTFGALRNILTHSDVPNGSWDPRVFPDIAAIYQHNAAARGSTPWGFVPLTLAAKHAPRMPPLRAAFEMRRFAFANSHPDIPTSDDLMAISQFSLMKVLMKARRAIDETVAISLAFETINGLAKMAPVLPRHMQEFATQAKTGT
jgi:hypothetical protein